MKRQMITTPKLLIEWRLARGLTQIQAAAIFYRSRRMYQYLEAGQHIDDGLLPPDIDDLAKLYDMMNRKRKGGKK